jgi:hypothetical protein
MTLLEGLRVRDNLSASDAVIPAAETIQTAT